ncbi:MAG: gliding motility-associated C-terminal domain-containing protein [Saprospiraceae bacterium]
MRIIYIVFIFIYCTSAHSQTLYLYDLDDCALEEFNGSLAPLTLIGNPKCGCAMENDGYYFDGNGDGMVLPIATSELFSGNFTIDFYFKPDRFSDISRIFSQRANCNSVDSLLALTYDRKKNQILFEIGSNISNYRSVRKTLDEDKCWHRFTLVKFKTEYTSYLDNEEIERFIARENAEMSRINPFVFGAESCPNLGVNAYSGWIDNISITTRALSELEILRSYAYPDRIQQPNTTIFKGDTISLSLGSTCATNFVWSPDGSLSENSVSEVLAFPELTTTYKISVAHQDCISQDSVIIYVAQEEDLRCDGLLLPNAFTPNNDGLNDTYGISNSFIVDALTSFEVYDRWGAKIWETRNLEEGWDGSINGVPVPLGMYICRVVYLCQGKENTKYKNFSVIR